jgi:hypothetical protein
MTIDQMHLAVKLGLDKTEGLVYAAFEVEEIDWWLNEAIDRFIKTRYSGTNIKRESFEQSQKRTDDLRTLVSEARIAGGSLQTGASDKPNSYLIPVASFPTDYMLFLNDEVSITFNNEVTAVSTTIRTYPIPCTSDLYSASVNDPYSEHRLHMSTARPLRMFTEKGIELITDANYTIPYYYMKYLRKPTRVNLALTAAQTAGTSDIEEGITYLVSTNNVIYNGVTYAAAASFTGVAGVSVFTGTGTATPQIAHCDLPDHTHREVVNLTVKILAGNIESQGYQVEAAELAQNE